MSLSIGGVGVGREGGEEFDGGILSACRWRDSAPLLVSSPSENVTLRQPVTHGSSIALPAAALSRGGGEAEETVSRDESKRDTTTACAGVLTYVNFLALL